jgi:hypothetical protein
MHVGWAGEVVAVAVVVTLGGAHCGARAGVWEFVQVW